MTRCPKCRGKIEDELMGCTKCGYKPYFDRNNTQNSNAFDNAFDTKRDGGSTGKTDRSKSIFDTNPTQSTNNGDDSGISKYKSICCIVILIMIFFLRSNTFALFVIIASRLLQKSAPHLKKELSTLTVVSVVYLIVGLVLPYYVRISILGM